MGPDEIRELIELVSQSQLKSLELQHADFRIKLVRQDGASPGGRTPADAAAVDGVVPQAAPSALPEAAPPRAAAATPAPGADLVEIKAPIVGTFFRSPSPESPAFVEVGSRIEAGQTLCIVEAMKVMNEIEAELDGEIVAVLVANGQPVEYGEALFRVRPA